MKRLNKKYDGSELPRCRSYPSISVNFFNIGSRKKSRRAHNTPNTPKKHVETSPIPPRTLESVRNGVLGYGSTTYTPDSTTYTPDFRGVRCACHAQNELNLVCVLTGGV